MKRFFAKYLVVLSSAVAFGACTSEEVAPDYRQEMRDFIIRISAEGEQLRPGFVVIPQNGLDLLTEQSGAQGAPNLAYIGAIDGCGQEELFYGYDNQNNFLSENYEEQAQWLAQCRFANTHGLKVLVTDYCSAPDLVTDSYNRNDAEGFISFAAESRELDLVPSAAHHENTNNIDSLSQAQNFLYCIAPSLFATKEEFLTALENSRHDVIIMDLFYEDEMLTAADIARLQNKPQGGRRLVIAYMSIGQAESYRWYWKNAWNVNAPSFLLQEDPSWVDNYYVRYWDPNWQSIIMYGSDSYLHRITSSGFDGVYLDIVNAFEYFEQ